jgi:hypothetical protein
MASMALSWWIGLAVAPAVGAPFLSSHPSVVFLAGCLVSLAALVAMLRLDRLLPVAVRETAAR